MAHKRSTWLWGAAGLVVGIGLIGVAVMVFDPFHTQFDDVEDARMYTAGQMSTARQQVDQLRVMTWNIKFGGGRIDFFFDCRGDRVIMDRDEVIAHLEGVAAKIRQVDPDVLLLQEVDIDSKRAAYVDQAQWLVDHTALNYGAYASQWRASFVPSHGLGRVNSGNAVLAKWPIDHAQRLALPLIGDQDPITRYFYLKRNILRARIEAPGAPGLWVANIHTAAFSHDGTKAKQIEAMVEELAKFSEQGKQFVAGGDFNTVPPGSHKLKAFPDAVCEDEEFMADDYSPDVGVLDELYARYQPAIARGAYTADNEPYFTHTTDKQGFWNRKLDYLFTNGHFVAGSSLVHQDPGSGGMATMPLSDHAPITTILEWE